jgi:AbiU2
MAKRKTTKEIIDALPDRERIELAKGILDKVLDHFLYILALHANNKIITYSPTLVSQIPTSFAASAFNVFQRGMLQIEIIRLCALWDGVDLAKENIPTVIELVDKPDIIDALADETRSHWHKLPPPHVINPSDDPEIAKIEEEVGIASNVQFGNEQAVKSKAELTEAIASARAVLTSAQFNSVMNIRDKHLAHSLERTRREQTVDVQRMKYGDETALIGVSIPIIERLRCWVNGAGFNLADSQRIDDKNAQALWHGCTFKVLR